MALKSSMKILLVDAEPGSRQVVKKMLTNMGFKKVIEAGDGQKAWDKIMETHTEDPVGLVISNWDLPAISGLDLLKKVRGSDKFPKMPFLMVTGEAAQQNVVIAVKSGVNNVVVKPFSSNTLMEKIGKIFGQG